jgi:hypothetical protein
VKKLIFAVIALATAFAVSPAALASSLCPSSASTGGYGTDTFSSVACAETMSISNSQDYARLMWNSTNTGYPANLTLGNLGGITSSVTATSGTAPYYMLAFTNPGDSFLNTTTGDQILLIEFQNSTLSGSTMKLDPKSTLFNLYDNEGNGKYLEGGQQDTHTLAAWIALDPNLSSDQIQEIRLAIGMSGGPGAGESLTVNSVDVTATPEPSSLLLLGTGLAGIGGFVRRRLIG